MLYENMPVDWLDTLCIHLAFGRHVLSMSSECIYNRCHVLLNARPPLPALADLILLTRFEVGTVKVWSEE